jgi:peptidoglycan/xylan/chitin deacetylase (PgdA/CDA1 family)
MTIFPSLKPRLLLLAFLLLSGCSSPTNLPPSPFNSPTGTSTPIPVLPTLDSPTETPLPTLTPTTTLTPTPAWVFQSGTITCPILLFHRIEIPPSPNSISALYYMAPSDFQWQMQALKDWGYTTIPISLLVEAIMTGAPLPPRPVVITFDDGYETVYQNAYPIMQALGFTGVMYLIGTAVGAQGYMDVSQIQGMIANGWEIGSHSMTHPHLPAVEDQIGYEAGHSKALLGSEFVVNVETFAYPYGDIDPFVVGKVAEYGYFAAVGLGKQYTNNLKSLYYLSRIEIQHGTDLAKFTSMLPWSGQP